MFPQEQEEEIEAVLSYFGDELVTMDRSAELLEGRISIELEPFPEPIVLYVAAEGGRKQFETRRLSPVDLLFRLPSRYPAVAPELTVGCVWLPHDWALRIHDGLAEVVRENSEFPMLFLASQYVVDFVQEHGAELAEICLDGSPYSVQNNTTGDALLSTARSVCEDYDAQAFIKGSHDCQVCFETAPGAECYKFRPCDHVFCKDCVKAYFQMRLTEQAVTPLSCLSDRCQSYPSDKLIAELVGQEQFDRYQEIILSSALVKMDDVVLCPRVSCGQPGVISTSTTNLATCLVCNFNFCTNCRRAYHGVDACRATVVAVSRMVENEDGTMTFKKITVDEYQAASEDQRKEMAWWYGGMEKLEAAMDEAMGRDRGQEWVQKYTRPCPGCGIAVFHEDGCYTMYCRCGTSFCYGCGEAFSGDGSMYRGPSTWKSATRQSLPCAHHKPP